MIKKELAAIEERCAKATPGPWSGEDGRYSWYLKAPDPRSEDPILILSAMHTCQSSYADKSFIVHSREDVEALLEYVRELESYKTGKE